MGEIVDNIEQKRLTERMVITATEFGVNTIQQLIKATLVINPHISLKDFDKVLQEYVEKAVDEFALRHRS